MRLEILDVVGRASCFQSISMQNLEKRCLLKLLPVTIKQSAPMLSALFACFSLTTVAITLPDQYTV